MPKEKEDGFIKETWKGVVASLISLCILGVFSFTFSSILNRLETVEALATANREDIVKINTLLTSEFRLNIKDLTDDLDETDGELNSVDNKQRSLERSVDRLEIKVKGLDK
jgi:hypothetical protein